MRGRWAGWLAIAAGCAAALAGVAGGATPTDPQAVHASYAALNLPAAWDLSTGAPEIVVAVVDTGVDPSHPDLAGAVDAGYDFVDSDDDALDLPGFGHGTAVAGVVAARANNGLGGIGTCFGCHVMPLRVIGLDGIARNVDTAAAIDYAVDHGAAVVNASINGERFSQRLREAIVRARAAGVLVVAAAGNEANAEPRYPAAFPEAISVTSATTDGRLATFASYGEWVKFAAPDCAPVTALGGGSDVACATSVSTPLVAGVVGLMRARAPFASADELEAALASTARPVPGTRYGLVDAAAALTTLGTPTARLAPVVLGRPAMREVLEAWSGVWSRAPLAVAYQWERCREESCSPIAGATTPRYTVTALDAGHGLRVAVAALGAASAVSATTAVVAARAAVQARPSINGAPRVGALLVANRGTWGGTALEFSLRWQRCLRGVCVSAGGGARYRVRPRDRGHRLRVQVLGTNELGSTVAHSGQTRVVR